MSLEWRSLVLVLFFIAIMSGLKALVIANASSLDRHDTSTRAECLLLSLLFPLRPDKVSNDESGSYLYILRALLEGDHRKMP